MGENKLDPVSKGSEDGGTAESSRATLMARWRVLLIAYGFLLVGTGYIAFFQPQYNPAVEIDEEISALIADENTRELTLESLREEGIAFKARRELAVQSFNVVLGAVLGFLSATAAQLVQRSGSAKGAVPPDEETRPT